MALQMSIRTVSQSFHIHDRIYSNAKPTKNHFVLNDSAVIGDKIVGRHNLWSNGMNRIILPFSV